MKKHTILTLILLLIALPVRADIGYIDDLSDAKTYTTSVYLGSDSGSADTYSSASYNTGLGIAALKNTTNGGTYNTALGHQAMNGNTTGDANTGLGESSLYSNTTGDANTALGYSSLYSNTTGSSNVAIGLLSLLANTIGATNTAIGTKSLFWNINGSNLTALGEKAGYGVFGQSHNNGTFLGTESGYGITTGRNNTLTGFRSGYAVTSGANNITLGYKAGNNITTGSSNIIIGADTEAPLPEGSNQLNIGNTIYGDTSTKNIGIGVIDPSVKLDVAGVVNASDFTIDGESLLDMIGSGGATSIDDLSDAKTYATSVYLGSNSGSADTYSSASYNTGLGIAALKNTTNGGTYNTAIGESSLYSNTTGDFNIALGESSLYSNTTGSSNVAIGLLSLLANTIGATNTAVGTHSLFWNINGSNLTALGEKAGYGVFGQSHNNGTFLGTESGYGITTGRNNTLTGFRSGYAVTSGANNVTLGYKAGNNITTGSSNIMIGAGTSAPLPEGSNQLNIGNTIYGDTLTGNVGIGISNPTAKLEIVGSPKVTPTTSATATKGTFWINTPKNTISIFLGDSLTTASYGANEYSGNIRYNGIATGWGDLSYYPKGGGDGNFGQFRFASSGSSVVTTPNAKVGVGSLYSAGNVGIGTTSPTAKLEVKGKTITDVLSLVPRTTRPATAVAGDIYSYINGSSVALCMYSGTAWVKIGGSAASCPL